MSLPYFPMFPSDFEAKTSHLTLSEDGAYNRLLRISWMTPGCTMPADEAWIMRRARAHTDQDKADVRAILAEFFTVENGRYSNAKLMRIWADANEAHEKRKNAGAKGGKAKSLKTNKPASSNAVAKPKQPEPEPEPYKKDTNVSLCRVPKEPARFTEFWDVFPHRGGAKKGRKEALAKYKRAVDSGVSEQTLFEAARSYRTDADVLRGYGKGPVPWLNQEGWNDEIAQPQFKAINGGQYAPHNSQPHMQQDRPDAAIDQITRLA